MSGNVDRAREFREVLEECRRNAADRFRLLDAVRREHEDHHDGVLRWCKHPACVEAYAVDRRRAV